MGAEYDVEVRGPALAAVVGGFPQFAHTAVHRPPGDALLRGPAVRIRLVAEQYHAAALHAPLQHQQVAAGGDPGLVPELAGGVVDAEALAGHAAGVGIDFVDHAVIEDQT